MLHPPSVTAVGDYTYITQDSPQLYIAAGTRCKLTFKVKVSELTGATVNVKFELWSGGSLDFTLESGTLTSAGGWATYTADYTVTEGALFTVKIWPDFVPAVYPLPTTKVTVLVDDVSLQLYTDDRAVMNALL